MHHTKSDIFWKCWLWAAIIGSLVAGLYAFVSGVGPRWISGGDRFFDLLILLGITGAYFGAGLVGWRIADKYYHAREKQFIKRYIRYSILTFAVLVGVTYSPLSALGLLWSLVPPLSVILALNRINATFSKPR